MLNRRPGGDPESAFPDMDDSWTAPSPAGPRAEAAPIDSLEAASFRPASPPRTTPPRPATPATAVRPRVDVPDDDDDPINFEPRGPVRGGPSAEGSPGFEDSLFGPSMERPATGRVGAGTKRPGPGANRTAVAAGRTKGPRAVGRIVFPKPGEAVGGFRIVGELGRGAFARVYHAEEINLANRPVALKVSKAEGDEPRVLARLQHSHIVPIHSVHDDPESGLRLMCMPYFGGANLCQVLDAAQVVARGDQRGKSLVEALDRVGKPCAWTRGGAARGGAFVGQESAGPFPSDKATVLRQDASRFRLDRGGPDSIRFSVKPQMRSLLGRLHLWSRVGGDAAGGLTVDSEDGAVEVELAQPNRAFLRGTSFVRASVWIVARLAEGLEHAHSRGLLHRDLKPSNILITADGTPMLLDFNLAADAPQAGHAEVEKARLGGTLPYMAPEHLDAFNPDGRTTPEMVDERSDLYSLGLILFEMIAGSHPFSNPPDDLSKIAILRYMMKERSVAVPSLREANPRVPWSLDAIARKALAPDPDRRYQSAREFAEDLRAFLDDMPLKHVKEPSLQESIAKWARRHPRASSASGVATIAGGLLMALVVAFVGLSGSFNRVAARVNLRIFDAAFQECQFLLNTTSAGNLGDHLSRGLARAGELRHRFDIDKPADWTRSVWMTSLSPEERARVREDVVELALLDARARVTIARDKGEGPLRDALKAAVAELDRAEKFEPEPSHSLHRERAAYHAALGESDKAAADRRRAAELPLKNCRDLYLTATSELARGRTDVAERLLDQAVELDQRRYWTWFALGLCHLQQRRYDAAAGDFAICGMVMPDFAWSHLNRGVALAKGGRIAEARHAFDKAVKLSPNFVEALVHRGLVELEQGDAPAAEADFNKAVSLGRGDPIVRAALAESLSKQGRFEEAVRILDGLIDRDPANPVLLTTRGMIRLRREPELAAKDFQAALDADPDFAQARYGRARSLAATDKEAAWTDADLAYKRNPNLVDALELRMLLGARLGRRDALDDVERLLNTPDRRRIYNAACALSLLGAKLGDPKLLERAIETLKRALDAGYPREEAAGDPDLIAIRGRW